MVRTRAKVVVLQHLEICYHALYIISQFVNASLSNPFGRGETVFRFLKT